jgi:hypothetical protein
MKACLGLSKAPIASAQRRSFGSNRGVAGSVPPRPPNRVTPLPWVTPNLVTHI